MSIQPRKDINKKQVHWSHSNLNIDIYGLHSKYVYTYLMWEINHGERLDFFLYEALIQRVRKNSKFIKQCLSQNVLGPSGFHRHSFKLLKTR